MNELKIVRLRRWPNKSWVYAELRRGDELVISATLDYIQNALNGSNFKVELEGNAREETPYCVHCRCQLGDAK